MLRDQEELAVKIGSKWAVVWYDGYRYTAPANAGGYQTGSAYYAINWFVRRDYRTLGDLRIDYPGATRRMDLDIR